MEKKNANIEFFKWYSGQFASLYPLLQAQIMYSLNV